MLSPQSKALISAHSAGMVATVNDDGTPSVSPKATFVILSDTAIAFGNIRSPHTLANIRERPAVEVCFIDVVRRKSVRVVGTATIARKDEAGPEVHAAFDALWSTYTPHMTHFVTVDVTRAEFIVSPAYDLGFTEEELRQTNLDKLSAL